MRIGNFSALISEGELAREHRKYDKALSCFDRAIRIAGSEGENVAMMAALSHRALVWKHLFEQTGRRNFLELTKADSEAGLAVAKSDKSVPAEVTAPLLLRLGDYYRLMRDRELALSYYHQALDVVSKSSPGKVAEYESHYALALIEKGQVKKGFMLLSECLQAIQADQSYRPFHRLIVESGIWLRMAEAYKGKNPAAYEKALTEAEKLAKTLKIKHKMPMRLVQVENLRREKM